MPLITARYSATLLVAMPIRSATSSITVPSGSDTTTPIAAGPGLPRAPPSTLTTSFKSLLPAVGPGRAGPPSLGRKLRKLAGHPRPPAVAYLPIVVSRVRCSRLAARGLAPVDDHGHVRVVGVVLGQLV